MNSESVISERGQVTLPKDLRDKLGLRPGTSVTFKVSKEGLLLKKSSNKKPDFRSVFGIIKSDKDTDELLKEMRGDVE